MRNQSDDAPSGRDRRRLVGRTKGVSSLLSREKERQARGMVEAERRTVGCDVDERAFRALRRMEAKERLWTWFRKVRARKARGDVRVACGPRMGTTTNMDCIPRKGWRMVVVLSNLEEGLNSMDLIQGNRRASFGHTSHVIGFKRSCNDDPTLEEKFVHGIERNKQRRCTNTTASHLTEISEIRLRKFDDVFVVVRCVGMHSGRLRIKHHAF